MQFSAVLELYLRDSKPVKVFKTIFQLESKANVLLKAISTNSSYKGDRICDKWITVTLILPTYNCLLLHQPLTTQS